MSMDIGNHVFEGPFTSAQDINEAPGMFVVFCHAGDDYKALDCGISGDVRMTLQRHARTRDWQNACAGSVEFAVLYSDDDDMLDQVEAELRARHKFPCRDAAEGSESA